MGLIRFVLELVGLVTIIWFIYIAREEYIKIREREEDG